MAAASRSLPLNEPIVISDDSDTEVDTADEADEADDAKAEINLLDDNLRNLRIRATPEDTAEHQSLRSSLAPRGFTVQVGNDVELEDDTFLRIVHILRHVRTQDVILKGIHFFRARHVGACFARQQNELVARLPNAPDGTSPAVDSILVTRPISSVVMLRDITLTNAVFPLFSFRHDGKLYFGKDEKSELAGLTCRWKSVEYTKHRNGHVLAGAMMLLSEAEADPGKGVSEVVKKLRWLDREESSKPKAKSGSLSKTEEAPGGRQASMTAFRDAGQDPTPKRLRGKDEDDEIEIIEERSTPAKRLKRGSAETPRRTSMADSHRGRKPSSASKYSEDTAIDLSSEEDAYTYGDICAGAGGMARAATETGDIAVAFTVDNWSPACRTLKRNFRRARVLEASINQFCTEMAPEEWMLVDILHISFPCQYWSIVHTVDGQNDAANIAAIYSVQKLVERTRPRVITFEQAPGLILVQKHRQHWEALIHQITSTGYNVRWKILRCSEYGNSQKRDRLFLIASCPGEPLPPFPEPTHGPGRLPFVTIQDCLDRLPPDHEIEPHMWQCTRKDVRPRDPNVPLSQCITTNGGLSDTHPSGKRSYTAQELAMLQTLPPYHKFAEDKLGVLRKQIGNAVPTVVGEKILREVAKSMRAADRVVAAYKPEEISLLDDDDG